MNLRIAILGSTRGSNLEPLVQSIKAAQMPAEIVLVLSDKADALILERAKNLNLPVCFLSAKGLTREEYGKHLDASLKEHQVDVVLLIGFMRILSGSFTQTWAGKILNVHPSLLPRHAGLMDLEVHTAAINAGEAESGCTVHIVEEIVDGGKILIQKKCALVPGETPQSLKSKVQALEVPALVEALKLFC